MRRKPFARVEIDYFEHEKTLSLERWLKDRDEPDYKLASKMLIKLWMKCIVDAQDGDLSQWAPHIIESWVGWEGKDGQFFHALCVAGFVDTDTPVKRINASRKLKARIHNWWIRAGFALYQYYTKAKKEGVTPAMYGCPRDENEEDSGGNPARIREVSGRKPAGNAPEKPKKKRKSRRKSGGISSKLGSKVVEELGSKVVERSSEKKRESEKSASSPELSESQRRCVKVIAGQVMLRFTEVIGVRWTLDPRGLEAQNIASFVSQGGTKDEALDSLERFLAYQPMSPEDPLYEKEPLIWSRMISKCLTMTEPRQPYWEEGKNLANVVKWILRYGDESDIGYTSHKKKPINAAISAIWDNEGEPVATAFIKSMNDGKKKRVTTLPALVSRWASFWAAARKGK